MRACGFESLLRHHRLHGMEQRSGRYSTHIRETRACSSDGKSASLRRMRPWVRVPPSAPRISPSPNPNAPNPSIQVQATLYRGGLAQLVRASVLHTEGQRFESSIPHQRARSSAHFSANLVSVSMRRFAWSDASITFLGSRIASISKPCFDLFLS